MRSMLLTCAGFNGLMALVWGIGTNWQGGAPGVYFLMGCGCLIGWWVWPHIEKRSR